MFIKHQICPPPDTTAVLTDTSGKPRVDSCVCHFILKLAAGGGGSYIWKYAGLPAPNMT